MLKEFVCITCPQGCNLQVTVEDGKILDIQGNACPRGAEYARQEITAPMRTIASSIKILGGVLPLASVRLSGPIPKADIFPAMAEIRKVSMEAPVKIGDVVLSNLLGTGQDVRITKNVDRK